jgi:hypothetical protein
VRREGARRARRHPDRPRGWATVTGGRWRTPRTHGPRGFFMPCRLIADQARLALRCRRKAERVPGTRRFRAPKRPTRGRGRGGSCRGCLRPPRFLRPDVVRPISRIPPICRRWSPPSGRWRRCLPPPSLLAPWRGRRLCPHDGTTRAIEANIRARVDTICHPVGICRMGSDPEPVADPALRVREAAARRRCRRQAPRRQRGNTNTPTIGIAGKAADPIRAAAPSS